MRKYLLLILLIACTTINPQPEFGYSVYSTVEVSSILFEDLKVEKVRVIFHRIINGDTITTDRETVVDCSKIRVSGAILPYEYPSTHRLWTKVYFKFSTQEGWTYMMAMRRGSLEYIDVGLTLGIIDDEFRLSKVLDAKTIYSTDDVKDPVLTWELPDINKL